MNRNVVVVGGGLTGLAASIYLARGGRSVTLFEKQQYLGGRAITSIRHGFRFNLGAHLFYRGGAAASVCRELGIPIRGAIASSGAIALLDGETFRLPTGVGSLITTSLLSLRGKGELAAAAIRIGRSGGSGQHGTVAEWLDQSFVDPRARQVMAALVRHSTLCVDSESLSAAAALDHMKVAFRRALYIDEGWQKIVDALHSAAVSSGVNFVTSSRVIGVHHDGDSVREVEFGGLELDADRMDTQKLAKPEQQPPPVEGARIPAETVLLAVDPGTAAQLSGDVGRDWDRGHPLTAASLDVALRSLPQPRLTRALSIDEPMQLAVHSSFAQLTPKGGALIHVTRYLSGGGGALHEKGLREPSETSAADEAAMESLLDRMQPGWRDLLVHRRFLPALTVSNAMPTPDSVRPGVQTAVRGLYLAGDWVGDEGMLANAALASARAAARAILATASFTR